MRKMLLLAGALVISGCTSDYRAEYHTDCNVTDAELQVRIHQIATDLSAKIGAPLKHGDSLNPAIEYDIDLPAVPAEETSDQLILKEYAGKITVDIAGKSDDARMKHVRNLVEEALKQNNCTEWEFS